MEARPRRKACRNSFPCRHHFRERKFFEISAWIVNEVGKSWAEADGDTAETIDF